MDKELQELIERREQERKEFYVRYDGAPEKLAEDLKAAINKIEGYGYVVRPHENRWLGRLNEERPVVYAILRSDYSTVYGMGSCDVEQVMRFAANCDSSDAAKTDGKSIEATPEADPKKEREYDLIYNEGEEGYNPYRFGSVPTYKTEKSVSQPEPDIF